MIESNSHKVGTHVIGKVGTHVLLKSHLNCLFIIFSCNDNAIKTCHTDSWRLTKTQAIFKNKKVIGNANWNKRH